MDRQINWNWQQFESRDVLREFKKPTEIKMHFNSPRSSLESSLGGLWFLCVDKFEECELLLVLLMLFMFNKLCWGGPPKWGRVKKGANIGNWPNCRKGAQGRDRGAKCAATAASWRAGWREFDPPPDMLDNIFWCPKTIINNDWNRREISLLCFINSFCKRQNFSLI